MTYGTINVDQVTNSDGVTSGGLYGFKNRIINGAMVIDQRNAGASVTIANGGSSYVYTVDRWSAFSTQNSKISVQQNAGSVTPPAGFTNYLGVTALAATTVASGDIMVLKQAIEANNTADFGIGAAGASSFTISFWVRSSLTGTFGGSINNIGITYACPFTFAISSANTWEYKTVTFTGPVAGTWQTGTGVSLQLILNLGTGSTYVGGTSGTWAAQTVFAPSGTVNMAATNGATFYITGVQLEKGSTATSFDYRPYGTELALCQRYFAVAQLFPATLASSTVSVGHIKLPVEMRSAPSASYVSGLYLWNPAAANQPINSISASNFTTTSGRIDMANSAMSSVTAGMGLFTLQNSAGAVQLSSEL